MKSSVTSVPSETGSATANPDQAVATGFADLLFEKVEAGEWTMEEGLVTLLKLFAGEIPAGDAGLGKGVHEAEASGVVQMATDYIRSGTDDAVKSELLRLLKLIVPSQATLDAYTRLSTGSSRGPGVASHPQQTEQECANLWSSGFPDPRSPSFKCFLSGDASIGGYDYRVYYPIAWQGDAAKEPYYAAAIQAINDTIPIFQSYGQVKSIYFVFNTLGDATTPATTLAITAWNDFLPASEACPIILYPNSLALSMGDFKQVIAHEIFHCYQAWNLYDQSITAGYTSSKWWVEGAAEYFSNVVYPANDYEHDWSAAFSSGSATKSLVELSYENFAFMQFIANATGGPAGVLSLLQAMPKTSTGDQMAALAAYPNMDALFEQFTQSFLDGAIIDSSGSPIEFPVQYSRIDLISGTMSTLYTADPFILHRYEVSFDPETRFTTSSSTGGAPGHEAARSGDFSADWSPIPSELVSGCSGGPYMLYVITTQVGQQHQFTLNTTSVGDAPCDQCLVGGWEATTASYADYMQSAMSTTGDVIVDEIIGQALASFENSGSGMGGYQDFVVKYTQASSDLSGSPLPMQFILTFSGFTQGPWMADGSNLTFAGGDGKIDVAMQAFISGQPVDLGDTAIIPLNTPGGPIGSGKYTCSGDTLTYWPPVPGVEVSPIIFKRTY